MPDSSIPLPAWPAITVLRLDVPRTPGGHPALHTVKLMIARGCAASVKRWRDGNMALHWCAAAMTGAAK